MKDNRPIFLTLWQISFPAAAVASICHRVSGVAIFVGLAPVAYGFYLALGSAEGFAQVRDCLSGLGAKWLLLAFLSAWTYHTLAGIRHLFMDIGLGETVPAGRLTAWTVFVLTALATIALALWLGVLPILGGRNG